MADPHDQLRSDWMTVRPLPWTVADLFLRRRMAWNILVVEVRLNTGIIKAVLLNRVGFTPLIKCTLYVTGFMFHVSCCMVVIICLIM